MREINQCRIIRYSNVIGDVKEGIEIKAKSKRDAGQIADDIYGDSSSVRSIKSTKKKILGII